MKEALKLVLEALESGVNTQIGRLAWTAYDSCLINEAITAIKEALAQPLEPHNFCPRCGKRAQGVLAQPQVHTCTPPLWGHQ